MKKNQLRQKILDRLPALRTDGRCPVPNSKFWDFYNERKSELADACIGVRKNDTGDWVVVAYEYEDAGERYTREISRMKALHNPECAHCKLDITTIRQSMCSNGRTQFKFLCQRCDRLMGGALPHRLVEYLVSVENFVIQDDLFSPPLQQRGHH